MSNEMFAPVQGPAARMICQRCHASFTVRPGRVVGHDRRQGCVRVVCDGVLRVETTVDRQIREAEEQHPDEMARARAWLARYARKAAGK